MLRSGATLHPHRSAIVMSGSLLWFGFLRVNAAGKHIGIRASRAVRGVRPTSCLVAALPRWVLCQLFAVACDEQDDVVGLQPLEGLRRGQADLVRRQRTGLAHETHGARTG